jgi:hypothetical protein
MNRASRAGLKPTARLRIVFGLGLLLTAGAFSARLLALEASSADSITITVSFLLALIYAVAFILLIFQRLKAAALLQLIPSSLIAISWTGVTLVNLNKIASLQSFLLCYLGTVVLFAGLAILGLKFLK